MCEETGWERRGLENKWIYVTLLYHARYLRVTIIQLYRDALLPLCEFRSPDSDKSNWRELNGKGGGRGILVLHSGQGAAGLYFLFLHVKLMLLIMREELIRDGTRARIGSFGVFCFKQTQLSTVLTVIVFNNLCKINKIKIKKNGRAYMTDCCRCLMFWAHMRPNRRVTVWGIFFPFI